MDGWSNTAVDSLGNRELVKRTCISRYAEILLSVQAITVMQTMSVCSVTKWRLLPYSFFGLTYIKHMYVQRTGQKIREVFKLFRKAEELSLKTGAGKLFLHYVFLF
jgi:hypothetical protein